MMALDGFGQVMETMDFVKRAWSTFNLPTPFSPTLNVEELDKRITDLRAVEQWLSLNQNMLRNTIQGLEIQRGTLNAVRTMSESFGKAVKPADDAMQNTLAQFAAAAAQHAAAGESPDSGPPPDLSPMPEMSSRTSASAQGEPHAHAPAGGLDLPQAPGINPLAWWNLLQSNFQQIAQAAASAQPEAASRSQPLSKHGSQSAAQSTSKSTSKPASNAAPAPGARTAKGGKGRKARSAKGAS